MPVDIRTGADGRVEIITENARNLVEDIELKQQSLADIITCLTGGASAAA